MNARGYWSRTPAFVAHAAACLKLRPQWIFSSPARSTVHRSDERRRAQRRGVSEPAEARSPTTSSIPLPRTRAAAMGDLLPETVPTIGAVLESLDGEDLLSLPQKLLQMMLAKAGADNATALAARVIAQRDALLPDSNAAETAAPTASECPICMEPYADDAEGMRVPRILKCGHTACHGCITDMLTRVNAVGHSKPFPRPLCIQVTRISGGQASNLPKKYSML